MARIGTRVGTGGLRVATIVQLTVLTILVLAFLGFAVARAHYKNQVQAHLEKIRAAGFPTSGSEVALWRPIPSNNGALRLNSAMLKLRGLAADGSNTRMTKLLHRTNHWSDATNTLVEATIRTNAAALEEIVAALGAEHFRYSIDYSAGFEALLPHLNRLKETGRLFALKAGLEAEQHQAAESAADILHILELAGTLDDEPLQVSWLVRCSLVTIAVGTTERALNWISFDAADRGRLQAGFQSAVATNLLPNVIAGERALAIPLFSMRPEVIGRFTEDTGERSALGVGGFLLSATGLNNRDLNFYLNETDRFQEIAALPPPQSLARTGEIDRAGLRARTNWCFISSMLSINAKLLSRDASMLAQAALVTSALAVEDYRAKQKSLPKTLDQALAPVPSDPFDGQPIRYRPTQNGYVLYSIDSDANDDGGREIPQEKKHSDRSTYDLTFIVEREK